MSINNIIVGIGIIAGTAVYVIITPGDQTFQGCIGSLVGGSFIFYDIFTKYEQTK